MQTTLSTNPPTVVLSKRGAAAATQDEPALPCAPPEPRSVAHALAQLLDDLGVAHAFGVSGGAMAVLWAALSASRLQVLHFRHEAGAAFAAAEASLASGRPVAVFTTTGPGVTNALTGIFAARQEGAKVVLLSASTAARGRGRWAVQETGPDAAPGAVPLLGGPAFDYAITLESAEQLPQIARRLALGLSRPGGFVAHLSIPTTVQSSLTIAPLPLPSGAHSRLIPDEETVSTCVRLLSEGPFAIWAGFGARAAAAEIRQLAELTGAAVMCSPRGKGIFPESHPQFVGVTGLGGHASVLRYMREQPPLRTLVLGTRLSEPTSFWSEALVPRCGFVHVDIDPEVPGLAYPSATTHQVHADARAFVAALLRGLSERPRPRTIALPNPDRLHLDRRAEGRVRPEALMDAIQRVIIDGSDATVLAESGNSFLWATHLLRFDRPNRYRISTGLGAMGHVVTGVVGTALVRKGKAVAITGDGAMLANNEISTAVKYRVPAVWVVLNDACYNMCRQGMTALGLTGGDAELPPTDFVAIARGMGADGVRVDREEDLAQALASALASPGPFVVDVHIERAILPPSEGRNQGLIEQGLGAQAPTARPLAFPMLETDAK
ncbi:thiamine pyrophosphate-dependent enzyme [Polyangium aurulentum]|uniref:thiamine pyrophosphate-dependent enzyme n=1 Tax=Polyangium aurulentum TaxID=2567896 RepID=UPI0010AE584B|nr:thiamine pyrophosphate-dependent enzyme [Polyangium aurulentum]UQA61627.1 thiamine pyrophosphate-binding protein [Polyangium aurulentum]